MKKMFAIASMLLMSFGAYAQSEESINVAWIGKGSGCYCPLDLCLEVCWCDETQAGSGVCIPGTETCNLDCVNNLQPGDLVIYSSLNVSVPSGKHMFMKKLRFNFSCAGEVEFDLLQPNGTYEISGFSVKPGCPPLTIILNNGYVMFSTGN